MKPSCPEPKLECRFPPCPYKCIRCPYYTAEEHRLYSLGVCPRCLEKKCFKQGCCYPRPIDFAAEQASAYPQKGPGYWNRSWWDSRRPDRKDHESNLKATLQHGKD